MNASGGLEVSPLPDPRSEQDLIQLVLSGRPEYFYKLVQPYERRVYRVAYGLLRNQADAEEVAQEAVLKALRKLSTFRGEARFSTWLLRIAMNEARMRLRTRRWDYASVPIDDDESSEYAPLLLANWKEVPSAVLERREVQEQIEKALAELSTEQREILILRDVEGFNTEEAASTLGISVSSAKTRLLRARLRMRDLLAPHVRSAPLWQERVGGRRRSWF